MRERQRDDRVSDAPLGNDRLDTQLGDTLLPPALAERGDPIGVATNNVAEYRALVAGLAKAVELGLDEVEVVSDSELLVKQMIGDYRVKNAALIELSLEASRLAREIGRVRYRAVRRTENELADRLVNEALDAAG